jgi:hypothetical protein
VHQEECLQPQRRYPNNWETALTKYAHIIMEKGPCCHHYCIYPYHVEVRCEWNTAELLTALLPSYARQDIQNDLWIMLHQTSC